jgi:urease accessory protein
MRLHRLSRTSLLAALFLLAGTSSALAHPGHADSASAAFLHPFTGFDHLLVILAIGVLAARLGGRALWALPLSFLSMMTIGSLLGGAGVSLPAVELGIAISVVGVGAMLAIGARPSVAVGAALAGAVAGLHGHAHGAELATSSLAMAVPFLASTALLQALGMGLGLASRRVGRGDIAIGLGVRALGAAMVVVGTALLLS